MLCIRCNKRPAIVFVQKAENGSVTSQGYCLSCARELGIKPLDDVMKQFGISESDLANMENQLTGMLDENGKLDQPRMQEMMQSIMPYNSDGDQMEEPEQPDDENGFTAGGAGTFPFSIFGVQRDANQGGDKKESKKQKRQRQKAQIP
jgi:ATP-dependent Clp protease ATP-binding subunit ClpC